MTHPSGTLVAGWRRAVAMAGLAMSLVAGPSAVLAQTGAEQRLSATLQDAPAREAAVRSGSKLGAFCANCHGAEGKSRFPDIPNLAGQNPAYLLEQIRKFGTGERKNDFMQRMIRALKEEEQVAIALYYADLPVQAQSNADAGLVERGHFLYSRVCFRCHGEQGRGNEKIPRIAGQQPSYLTLTLKRYRDRTGQRMDPLMAENTSMLKDADIQAVAAFVAGMP